MDEPPASHLPYPEILYQSVSDRRLQYENLLWQVPTVSLTAQAFLFSIAMAAENLPIAKVASSLLALIVSIISILLMASHRLAERKDTKWLERFEQQHLRAGPWGPSGAAFEAHQDSHNLGVGRMGNLLVLRHMFIVWVIGLGCFGVTAIFMILRALGEF